MALFSALAAAGGLWSAYQAKKDQDQAWDEYAAEQAAKRKYAEGLLAPIRGMLGKPSRRIRAQGLEARERIGLAGQHALARADTPGERWRINLGTQGGINRASMGTVMAEEQRQTGLRRELATHPALQWVGESFEGMGQAALGKGQASAGFWGDLTEIGGSYLSEAGDEEWLDKWLDGLGKKGKGKPWGKPWSTTTNSGGGQSTLTGFGQ